RNVDRAGSVAQGKSEKFVRRIIQFDLRIIEGVDMEIELDPIGSLFSTCARAHGGGRLGLRHHKPQARLNTPMTEKEPKATDCTAAPGKTRTLKTSAKLWFGKSACGSVSPIYHLLASKTARVVEWQTRTFEGRMPKGMRVQVPPRAPSCCWRGNPKSRVRYSMDEIIGDARDRKNGHFELTSSIRTT